MAEYKSLLQIYDERPDLQKAFPTKGTPLNDWWNVHGVKEYPGTTLVQPGDSRLTPTPAPTPTPTPAPAVNNGNEFEKARQRAEQLNYTWFGSGQSEAEAKYYRLENGQWIQKSNRAEAETIFKQPTPTPAPTPTPTSVFTIPNKDLVYKNLTIAFNNYQANIDYVIQELEKGVSWNKIQETFYANPNIQQMTIPTSTPTSQTPELTTPSGLTVSQAEALSKGETPLPQNPVLGVKAGDDIIAPENSLSGIRSVFGADWQPSPAFADLQKQGIFGAVRIKGTNEVYTIGPGGRKETAESYLQRFGTAEQKGIVGEISKTEAVKLGITDTGQTPTSKNITTEALTNQEDIDISSVGNADDVNSQIADTTIGGLEEYLKIQESLKTDAEKAAEKAVADTTSKLESLLEEDIDESAIQLAEEEERKIEEKQAAVDDADGRLSMKMGEINSLTASYQLENQIVEGKPIVLGRQQGQEAQNYKMYLAQKNLLTSEAGMIQSESLAKQGKLKSAQDAADRATDLRWNSHIAELTRYASLLELTQGTLTSLQKTRSDTLQFWATQEINNANDAKAVEKTNNAAKLGLITKYKVGSMDNTLEELIALSKTTATYNKEVSTSSGSGSGTTGDWQVSTAGGLLGLDKSTAGKFDTDLEQEIKAVESGEYGIEGARERALERLKTKYPGISNQQWNEIIYTGSDTLYPAFPDGYESNITGQEETQRVKSDEDLRSIIKGQIQDDDSRVAINNFIITSNLSDPDLERAKFLLSEMWPEGQNEANKQWRK